MIVYESGAAVAWARLLHSFQTFVDGAAPFESFVEALRALVASDLTARPWLEVAPGLRKMLVLAESADENDDDPPNFWRIFRDVRARVDVDGKKNSREHYIARQGGEKNSVENDETPQKQARKRRAAVDVDDNAPRI